jgi:hypothetical protein
VSEVYVRESDHGTSYIIVRDGVLDDVPEGFRPLTRNERIRFFLTQPHYSPIAVLIGAVATALTLTVMGIC